ncbi:GNAT family N-acetyltransferase [Tomitella fengzijianii]|uniref:GNAT family N-acetyltransferase n=1 Tax=Tomitella fengzijianii TaxID=2597660 RepID=A0A516WZJ3_9ACTN|nr:GNAT family N-acetyltransferase [Tomitella fengzijianii]QDQ96269.1 GNAT family N-acetyltransferase [Tomitella fengzijianii]
MAAVTIRTLTTASELAESDAVFHTSMVGLPAPAADEDVASVREPGRTFGAYADDGLLVGATDSTSGMLTVPGGARVPHAAVTHVGVLPTHTRRGVLTALMRHQLEDCRTHGETVASLRASEAVIYGRYGYGIASVTHGVSLDLRDAELRAGAVSGALPVRLVDPDGAWDLLRRMVDEYPSGRAGTISRSECWWRARRARTQPAPRYVAVCGDEGFVCYRPLDTASWFTSRDRTIVVTDLHARTPEVHRALVAFLLRLDLVHTVRFPWLPADDPLPWMLTDHRAARVTGAGDETWLRLVDVPAALAARSYGPGGSVTVRVDDGLLPANSGSYRIGTDGAEHVGDVAAPAPDAQVDVADLGAAYLGGVRWHQLRDAGRLREFSPGVADRLDTLFATARAPFAGVMF